MSERNADAANTNMMTTTMQTGAYSTIRGDAFYPHNQMHTNQPNADLDPMLGSGNFSTQTLNQVSRGSKPYIEITEQPRSRGLRFRYKCEGRSAGTIPGESSNNEHRTYPTIKICNYSGPSAIVVVSCVTKDDPPRPHPHSLVGKDCKQGVCTVKLKGTTTVSFPSLGIQCATKREVKDALQQREKIRVDPWGTGYFKNINSVELSTVRLAFQAFLPDDNGKYTRIVQPTVSQCIFDKKAINDLVICRLSKQSGGVSGSDEVFLLCEKVTKDDIQIRFFEETKEGLVWEKYGVFGQQDVHRQVAIVFKTPEYRDQNIISPVTVMVQLRRPSDDEVSDPKPFQFIPNDPDPDFVARKRKRKNVNFDSFMKDYKVPPTLTVAKDAPLSTRDTIKERLIKKVARNQPNARSVPDSTTHFQLQQYSMDNTGGQMQQAEPMNQYEMIPQSQQQHWQASPPQQMSIHPAAMSVAGPLAPQVEQQVVIADGTYGMTAEGHVIHQSQELASAVMNTDGSLSEQKPSDIFAMLRESNNAEGGYTGIVASLPSLPSVLIDNFNGGANFNDNLAILREENVAAEETVESMNEDIQMTPVSQSAYTNISQT